MGEVVNPTSIIYKSSHSADYYISKAGGSKSSGELEEAFIVRANGETEKIYSGWFSANAKIKQGDVIVIPLSVDTFDAFAFTQDLAGLISNIAITTATLKTIGLFE